MSGRTAGQRRGPHLRRGIALALVAAAVALIAGIGIAVQLSRDDATVERQLVAISAAPVRAQARLAEQPWGTSVTIEASGLSVGTTYGAWLERADGSRVVAGTFRADTDRVLVTLAAAIPLAEGRAVGVSTVEGQDVLRAPL